MIQKKICMVGVYATGKTSLVQQFVHSIFSVRYLSTVGVKIDRKEVRVGDEDVKLMLWDLEGKDGVVDVNPSYVQGAHGVIYVGDGTRPDTVEAITEMRDLVRNTVGEIPSVLALNKADLKDEWVISAELEESAGGEAMHRIRTSAKTGQGVEYAFQWLAEQTMNAGGASR